MESRVHSRRKFIRNAATGLLVPTLMSSVVRGTVPLPIGFWKPVASGAGGINPNSFSNLGAWWKADAIGGLANNDPVSTWNDSNGSNHLSGSGATRPLWLSNASGGMPGVKFDGGNDELSMASLLTLTSGGGWTIITVFIANGGGMQFGSSLTSNYWFWTYPTLVLNNAGGNPASSAFSTSSANLLVATVRGSTTFRENKTAISSTGVASGFDYNFNRMGRWSGGTAWGAETFCEIIIYNRSLADAECDSLYDGYLKPKYAVLP